MSPHHQEEQRVCVCTHRFDGLFDEVLLGAQVVLGVRVKHLEQSVTPHRQTN